MTVKELLIKLTELTKVNPELLNIQVVIESPNGYDDDWSPTEVEVLNCFKHIEGKHWKDEHSFMEKYIKDLEKLIEDYEKRSQGNIRINNRQLYNKIILDSLNTIVNKYPYMRFMQILGNLGYEIKYNGKDEYYEESFDTLKNINK